MEKNRPDDPVDRSSDQSFPASDPPSWTGTRAGAPRGHDAPEPGVPPLFDKFLDNERLHARVARHWWAIALKGAAAIVLGILAVAWPAITLLTLVLIFAAYCIVDAVLSVVLAVRGARQGGRWGWQAFGALVSLAAAAAALLYPGITLFVFAIMLAVWAVVSGAFTIAAGLRLRPDHGRWWMISGGAALVILGIILALIPPLGLFTLVWLVAVGAVVSGSALLGHAIRLRLRNRDTAETAATT
ncbi:MAG TPA: HdeD family acid-resistance protein [Sphingobium sp.]|nr:HdeD family acid-resistance protein [Sphingobium sp.]